MDPKSGIIYQVANEAEALARGLVPIPMEELEALRKASIAKSKAWAQRMLQTKLSTTTHPLGAVDPEDQRKIRNKLKAQRRARKGR